jgi:hypothetical protein
LAAAGAATSQVSEIDNDQTQAGDIFAGQTLDVVDVSDEVTVVPSAIGNSLSGAIEGADANLTSSQRLNGAVRAETLLTAEGAAGEPLTISGQAVGNTLDAGAYGGSLTGSVLQSADGDGVSTTSSFDAYQAAAYSGATVSSTAIVNSQGYGVSGGVLAVGSAQTSSSSVEATTEGALRYVPAQGVYASVANGNNLSASGEISGQSIEATQSQTGAVTRATTDVSFGNAWDAIASSNAIANNLNASNQGGALIVSADQINTSAVGSVANLNAYDFGASSANAYGVGNSVVAGNNDVYVEVNNAQMNSGGVEVSARVTGSTGYDADATASAIGNAVTGYACADCQGVLNATNRQTNSGGVSASSHVGITGSNRSVTGVSSAAGNSATFYVSSPGS